MWKEIMESLIVYGQYRIESMELEWTGGDEKFELIMRAEDGSIIDEVMFRNLKEVKDYFTFDF